MDTGDLNFDLIIRSLLYNAYSIFYIVFIYRQSAEYLPEECNGLSEETGFNFYDFFL